ncbi:hypothetical protein IG631_20901 [Alternaria alternata]|nr:hypothetical protein IG631_20901 [Alternaria alternata]
MPGSGQSGSTPDFGLRVLLHAVRVFFSFPPLSWRWRGQTMPFGDAVRCNLRG